MERQYIYIEEFSEFVYYYGAPIYREEFSELVYYYGKPAYIEDFSEFVPIHYTKDFPEFVDFPEIFPPFRPPTPRWVAAVPWY